MFNTELMRKDLRFASSTNNEIKKLLSTKLTREEFRTFSNTCFAFYLNIPDMSHQGVIYRCIRERQIKCLKKDQRWIAMRNSVLKFTLLEFALIIGLRCDTDKENFDYVGQPTCRLIRRYFRERDKVNKATLLDAFNSRVFGDNKDDAVKFGILVFITNFLFSLTPDATVQPKFFHLVETGHYVDCRLDFASSYDFSTVGYITQRPFLNWLAFERTPYPQDGMCECW